MLWVIVLAKVYILMFEPVGFTLHINGEDDIEQRTTYRTHVSITKWPVHWLLIFDTP